MAQAADPAPPESEPRWVRVRDKDTGHEYDIAPSVFDPAAHTRLNAPVAYPDLYGDTARPRPAKHRTDKAGQPVPTENQES